MLARQHDRWALWPPVAVILGAAAWMTAPTDPNPWIAPVGMIVATATAFALAAAPFTGRGRLRMAAAGAMLMVAAFASGALAAQIRTATVASPRVAENTGAVRLTGWVLDAEPGATRPRMKLLVDDIASEMETPRFVRLSSSSVISPGRAVSCLVLLRPPEGPMAPRSFDSARRFYFQKIGATGIVLGRCRPTNAPPPSAWTDRIMVWTAAVRRDLTESIVAMAPHEGGAIAAALVTGDRSFMSKATGDAFWGSGLGHLLSVSGLHMALIAGGIYAGLHFLLALIAPLALRYPIRKWAAATALIGGGLYLVVSGASVPAQRAFVMTALALGAILIDRPAFSLRALGVAAVIVVAIAPESVVDAGFQMSFAATAALIAAFERGPDHAPAPVAPGLLLGGLDSSWRVLSGMLVASLVAGLATDVFAVYHFQRVAVYGLASNMASTPLISFVIAPAAVIAAVLAPFGLADVPLAVMAGGLDMVAAIGGVFADRPEALRPLPVAPLSAFLLAIAALAWACLWRGAIRWGAAAMFAAAALLYATTPKPVLWADGDFRAIVAATPDGWVALADPRRGAFARGRLAGLAGVSALQSERLPSPDACDPDICSWTTPHDRAVYRVRNERGVEKACAPGAIVLSDAPLPRDFARRCGAAFAIDPANLAENGGLSVAESRDGISIRRARDHAGYRPWSGKLRRSGE